MLIVVQGVSGKNNLKSVICRQLTVIVIKKTHDPKSPGIHPEREGRQQEPRQIIL